MLEKDKDKLHHFLIYSKNSTKELLSYFFSVLYQFFINVDEINIYNSYVYDFLFYYWTILNDIFDIA